MTQATKSPPQSDTIAALRELGGIETRAAIAAKISMLGGAYVPLEEIEGIHELPQGKDRLVPRWVLTPDVLTCEETLALLATAFSKQGTADSRRHALSLAMTHIRDFRVPFGFTYPCRSCYVQLLQQQGKP